MTPLAIAPKTHLKQPRAASLRGFTLVELLTVIAIIGILAAIIVPVVGKVRDQAKRAACTSQVRQLGTALLSFINDNRQGHGPYNARDIGNQDTSLWRYNGEPIQFGLLLPYLNVDQNVKKTPQILICPGASSERVDAISNSSGLSGYWLNPDCGSNPNNSPKVMLNLPPRRVALMDVCAWWNTNLWPSLANHNFQGMNVFRLDGSVEWLPIEKTVGSPAWNWSGLDKI